MSITTATVTINGVTPYSQSSNPTLHPDYEKVLKEAKCAKNDHALRESLTWKFRARYNDAGNVIIPNMAFYGALVSGMRYTGDRIPGQGKKTWADKFRRGLYVENDVALPFTMDTIQGMQLFVPSDGKKGSSSKVLKIFPVMQEWGGTFSVRILDNIITQDVFAQAVNVAGSFVGLGRWRPEKEGMNGRFEMTNLKWKVD